MHVRFAALAIALTFLPAAALAAPDGPAIAAIPYPLEHAGAAGDPVAAGASLELAALKGTDLYLNADGSKGADNAPRAMFRPVGDFILTAKVDARFEREYDGAALVVYAGSRHWIKLLFENGKSGTAGVSSTVAKGVGDDAHHGAVPGKAVHLKIARVKDLYVLYTSADGVQWHMVRNVGMPSSAPVQVGFLSQSPVGERFSARFSDIRFRHQAFKDFWQGE